MPSRPTFLRWWKRLEERFGEQRGVEAYYVYLHRTLPSDEEFEPAAAAVWATTRFWPRPADFLLVGGASGWDLVRRYAPGMVGGAVSADTWRERQALIGERAWAALDALGGPIALRDSRDVPRFRREFLHAYELVVTKESQAVLPALANPKEQNR